MSDSSNASSLPTMPPTSKPNQPKMVKKPQSNLLANTTEERSDDMAKAFDAQGSFGKKFTGEGGPLTTARGKP